jgi:hypothetical protein
MDEEQVARWVSVSAVSGEAGSGGSSSQPGDAEESSVQKPEESTGTRGPLPVVTGVRRKAAQRARGGVRRGKASRRRPRRMSRPGHEESAGRRSWRRSSQYLRRSFKSSIYRSSWTGAAFLGHHLHPPLEVISLMHNVIKHSF